MKIFDKHKLLQLIFSPPDGHEKSINDALFFGETAEPYANRNEVEKAGINNYMLSKSDYYAILSKSQVIKLLDYFFKAYGYIDLKKNKKPSGMDLELLGGLDNKKKDCMSGIFDNVLTQNNALMASGSSDILSFEYVTQQGAANNTVVPPDNTSAYVNNNTAVNYNTGGSTKIDFNPINEDIVGDGAVLSLVWLQDNDGNKWQVDKTLLEENGIDPNTAAEVIGDDEMGRLYMAIDAQLYAENSVLGLPDPDGNADVAAFINDVVASQWQGDKVELSGLKNLWNKITDTVDNTLDKGRELLKKIVPEKVYNAADKVITKAGQIAENVAKIVHKVVGLPFRGSVMLVLKLLGGKAAPMFLYAFIPEDSPLLVNNPAVKAKRDKQMKAINILAKVNAFEVSYLLKHLRNAIVKHYGKTPEQLIQEKANSGLGFIDWAAIGTAVVALAPAIPALVGVFKKSDAPNTGDFQQNNSGNNNNSGGNNNNNNNGNGNKGGFMDFITSPAGIITSVATVGLVGWGITQLANRNKKRK